MITDFFSLHNNFHCELVEYKKILLEQKLSQVAYKIFKRKANTKRVLYYYSNYS